MKKVKVEERIKLIGERNYENGKKVIKYYLVLADNDKKYAFCQSYSRITYDVCKSGIRVNDLMRMKSDNTKLMKLVSRTKHIMPYLAEYYDIEAAC